MDQAKYRAAAAAWEEAGFGDADWTEPVEATLAAFGGTGLILHALDKVDTSQSEYLLTSASVSTEMITAYGDYIQADPRARYAPYARSGQIVSEGTFARHPDELTDTPAYAELFLPNNFGRCAAVRLDTVPGASFDASSIVMLNLLRHNDADTPDDRMCWHFLEIARSVQRSLRIATALEALRVANSQQAQALDLSPVGILFVRSSGLIVDANAAARRMLAARRAVTSVFGNLTILNLDSRAAFQRSLAAALAGSATEACTLANADGERPTGAIILPIRRTGARRSDIDAPSRADAIVMLIDPATDLTDSTSLWMSMYKLTKAEAGIARLLVQGCSPREISELRDVSFETVRTQCKRIYGKLGVSGNAAAVSMLMRTLVPPAT